MALVQHTRANGTSVRSPTHGPLSNLYIYHLPVGTSKKTCAHLTVMGYKTVHQIMQ